MNVCITNTVVEFYPSEKKEKKQRKKEKEDVETRTDIVNNNSECLSPTLATSMESQNTNISTYIDHKNIYQELIQTKQ